MPVLTVQAAPLTEADVAAKVTERPGLAERLQTGALDALVEFLELDGSRITAISRTPLSR